MSQNSPESRQEHAKLSTQQESKRPPIVLVHGFRGSPSGLQEIAHHLEQHGYLVHLPAVPPFAGASLAGSYNTDNYARFLADYIRAQQLDHPILIGHSMGSIIVAATAAAYPTLIDRRLILLSPISHRPAAPFVALAPLSALAPRSLVDYLTTRYLFVPHNHALFRQTLQLTHRCSSDRPPQRRPLMSAARFSAHHCIADFDLSRQDVLIIAGEKDRLIKQSRTAQLAQNLNAKLKLIAHSGHLHNYEAPHETADLILEFLENSTPNAKTA